MKLYKIVIPLCLVIFTFCSCKKENKPTILVKNTTEIPRLNETVELSKSFLKEQSLENIGIRDAESNKFQTTQLVDIDGDGSMDQLLFQPKVLANSEKRFEIVKITDEVLPEEKLICYSRFVPERTDDYAWENDKVAFRTFGPNAQYRAENNLEEGTLSSGVDAWLKKVDYPIINNWYKKYTDKTGSYHEDTGEGLDNFHVGKSRGVGGLGVKQGATYYYPKNFISWKTITNGPLRTSFNLEYEAFDANGKTVKISKTISLDKGQNLYKVNAEIDGVKEISSGLTLHEKDGEINNNIKNGWISYWQPHGDSELGTAILARKDSFTGFENYDVETKDLSNVYGRFAPKSNQVVFYSGFAWKERGTIASHKDWENYLNNFSKVVHNPLIVEYVN